jgi:hypothetical protein
MQFGVFAGRPAATRTADPFADPTTPFETLLRGHRALPRRRPRRPVAGVPPHGAARNGLFPSAERT